MSDKSQRFFVCLDFVLRHEGGYSDDVYDRGGETKYGISKRSYPHLDIKSLTKEQAAEIYYHDYWLPIRGESLPQPVDLVVFDTAVNSGVKTASKMLQRLVKAKPDGVIGPRTLAAVKEYHPQDVALKYCWERMKFFSDIVRRDPSQARFIAGWTNRVSELFDAVA